MKAHVQTHIMQYINHAIHSNLDYTKHMSNVYTCETKIYNANTTLSLLQSKEVRQYIIIEFYTCLFVAPVSNSRKLCVHS